MATTVLISGRRVRTTLAFESYWRLAAERQAIFFRRVRSEPPPWTADAVLAGHRFTNAYRASDRVSQYLINKVIYGRETDPDSMLLRVLLFKIFNRIDTWEALEESVGHLDATTFDVDLLSEVLDRRFSRGLRVYSAAYIMPAPRLGEQRKHANHLRLLSHVVNSSLGEDVFGARSLGELFDRMRRIPSFGGFLAFQFAIDLNYSNIFDFSEMDFVVAGPGARDGISKCFENAGDLCPESIIEFMATQAPIWFDAFGLDFQSLWGRPLQLIDAQNLFCEVSKYSRVAHPELPGVAGRTQIKQRYAPTALEVRPQYPPRWAQEYSSAIPVACHVTAIG